MKYLLLICLWVPCLLLEASERPEAREGWPAELRGARLVFETPEGIMLQEGEGEAVLWIRGGRWPRWSRSGDAVFFLRGKELGYKLYGTGEEKMIQRLEDPKALAVFDLGNEVWVGEGRQVKAFKPEDGSMRLVVEDETFRELDVGPEGKTMVATVRPKKGGNVIRFFHLESGETADIGKGCSASLSPDGRLATNNLGGHQELRIARVSDGETDQVLKTPKGHRTDNQYWSTHADWVVSQSEKKGQILVHRVSDGAVWKLTGEGKADRPDLWVP